MPSDFTTKQLRSMVSVATREHTSGPKGACLVFRHKPRTQVTCYETTEAACEIVNKRLGNDGHTMFEGVGTKCFK